MTECNILPIALTGTPGTGKTTVGRLLEMRGYHVLFLTEFIKENNISSEKDEERDCLVVDMDALEKAVSDYVSRLSGSEDESVRGSVRGSVLVIESHMAHYLCDHAIVFRTHPDILEKHLQGRNYSPEKIHENVMSEALDIILCEAYDWCGAVLEVDNSERTPEQSADAVEEIIRALLCLRDNDSLPEAADSCSECDDGNSDIFTDEGVEIYSDDGVSSECETILEKDQILRKYIPGSIDWSSFAD